jgi:oligogalacturonide lyase
LKGQVFPSETSQQRDPVTGVTVTQLTNHRGHSHHLYFTNSGWYDRTDAAFGLGRRLLLESDRANSHELYSLDLADGRITQLTEFGDADDESLHSVCLNPTRDEAYMWHGGDLVAVDLRTLATRVLCRVPGPWVGTSTGCSADGRLVCTSLRPTAPSLGIELRGYVGYRDYFLARPTCRIITVPTDGGPMQVRLEERTWIGHVNASPTQPHLLSFCHEGPWHETDQRVWGMDLTTGKIWKVRPQAAGDAIGHEYWMADGVTLGYHGAVGDGLVYGAVRYDNSGLVEAPFPHDSRHFHSLALDLVVGDGRPDFPYLLLWRFRGGAFDGPRVLCWHRGSSHVQATHVHPRFSADGRSVLYTSDESGYGNVYLADVPAFDSLPTLHDVQHGPKKPWVPFGWMRKPAPSA